VRKTGGQQRAGGEGVGEQGLSAPFQSVTHPLTGEEGRLPFRDTQG